MALNITEAFLLPREVNLGKAVDDDPEKISATAKNAQEELKFLMTLAQAFERHPRVVDMLVSLMKSNQNNEIGPFTLRAWLELKRGL